MELLAQGRDCDIFDLGDGTILRRSRKLYDQSLEAKVIAYAADHGYPVPKVHELRDGGKDLVMEKVEGPTLLEAIEKKPWRIGAYGRLLGDLHVRLHELPGPDFVPKVEGGDRFLHFDLHPLNVILSPSGPVVIDWTNACTGPPGADIARAWALMASAEGPVGFPLSLVLNPARRWLVRSFVDAAGREEARSGLRYGVELTLLDPNISDAEKDQMRALLEAEGL
jgi:aminoglycoside phosphotransferase (APT) family kinase protein